MRRDAGRLRRDEPGASEPVPIGQPIPPQDVPSQVVELSSGPSGPVIVWQLKVSPGGTYRSYRIGSLYPGVIWSDPSDVLTSRR